MEAAALLPSLHGLVGPQASLEDLSAGALAVVVALFHSPQAHDVLSVSEDGNALRMGIHDVPETETLRRCLNR